MSDLISRQAAIDAFLTELTKRERKNLLHTWSTVEVKYFVTDMLEHMPSAEPERKTEVSNLKLIEQLKFIRDYECKTNDEIKTMCEAIAVLSEEPERKTGEWIYHDDDDIRFDTYHCSVCKKMFTVDAERFDDIGFVKADLKYCPNCGAKMLTYTGKKMEVEHEQV